MDGSEVHDRQVTWRADDELIATVNSGGVVTARRPGIVNVSAATGGKSGTATLRVVRPAPVLARLEVRPTNLVLNVGESRQLSVHLFAADGSELPAPPAGALQWFSQNPGAVSVNASGAVTAHNAGEVNIRATFTNVHGTARVTVPSFVEYALTGAPIRIREYEIDSHIPNVRLFRVLQLASSEFRLGTDERSYQHRLTLEVWETMVFADGTSITALQDTVVTDDFGAAGTIAGVGDFVFNSHRNGERFVGRRSATSLEVDRIVPGALNQLTLRFTKE